MRHIRRINALAVVGTRPEAIKVAPLALAAAGRDDIAVRMLATGQHGTMFDEALAGFGLAADLRLPAVASDPDPDVAIARYADAIAPLLARERPDIVLVQGDTNSAYAGAIAASRLGIPVGHVEAGLRSGDPLRPWPEERNRIAIDALSTLLFAPTATAAANLAGNPHVHVTGNTGIDALLATHARLPPPPPGEHRSILLTCHRRENIGAGIASICDAAIALADRGDVAIVCPVHPNPAVAATVRARMGRHRAIRLVDPLPYARAVALLAAATIVLTDSGGVQEEAATLGIPTLVLRDETERPEGVASGNLRLVGTRADRIVAAAARLLDDPHADAAMRRRDFPFGQGDAATKILAAIAQHVLRPPACEPFLPSPARATTDGARQGA